MNKTVNVKIIRVSFFLILNITGISHYFAKADNLPVFINIYQQSINVIKCYLIICFIQ